MAAPLFLRYFFFLTQMRMTAHIVRALSTQIPASWGVSPAGAARVRRKVLQALTLEVTKRNP